MPTLPPLTPPEPLPTNRRRLLLSALAPLALGGLAACAGLPGGNHIDIPEATLRRSLLSGFPARQRVLELFDLSFGEPVLRLLPAENRLALAVDVTGRDRLMGQAFGAELSFDARLRWQPADSSLRLAEVRVDRLRLRHATGAAAVEAQVAGRTSLPTAPAGSGSPSMDRLARYVAEEALEGLRVHRLSEAHQAQLRDRRLQVTDVSVVASGLRIQLASAG